MLTFCSKYIRKELCQEEISGHLMHRIKIYDYAIPDQHIHTIEKKKQAKAWL